LFSGPIGYLCRHAHAFIFPAGPPRERKKKNLHSFIHRKKERNKCEIGVVPDINDSLAEIDR
jgi:hypothetical protein